MNKSILVIDTPENCIGCDFSDCELREYYCERVKRYLKGSEGEESRPDWCPILCLPKKEEVDTSLSEIEFFRRIGWNACINEILKGGVVE